MSQDLIKSRDLHLPDLFRLLQLEWITYKVRSVIYDRDCDIKKFNDILKMKEDKINKFALRNSVPSIFSSREKLDKYLELFYPTTGDNKNKAQFQYTPNNINSYTMFDRLLFYRKGEHVDVDGENCEITYNDNVKCELVLKFPDGIMKKLPYNQSRKDISYIFK